MGRLAGYGTPSGVWDGLRGVGRLAVCVGRIARVWDVWRGVMNDISGEAE